jgi:hypothetical protein
VKLEEEKNRVQRAFHPMTMCKSEEEGSSRKECAGLIDDGEGVCGPKRGMQAPSK